MNKIGSELLSPGVCRFSVWAPEKEIMILHIVHPDDQEIRMKKNKSGYFSVIVNGITAGTRFFYKPEGGDDIPDPASCYQPEGVHGPSEVVDHSIFRWNDSNWKPVPLRQLVLYELHVGTFTPEGTFTSIIQYLDELKSTGINAIELMPVAQFPGERNWGYDGVYPYSVQNSYGGPEGLKKLVDNCHQRGIAVFLDVVYNHIGPEGNYLGRFAPYFTSRYKVPWGDATNLDDHWCDGVREFFSGHAPFLMENYHIDGIRVDAIHMMFDSSAVHFWELTGSRIIAAEQKLGRKFYMIAESDTNNPRVVSSTDQGGYGFDAQWLDDFHHALYVLLHEEGKERYEDFGRIEQLAKAYKEGFVHSGEFVRFRKRKHGKSSAGIPGEKFIVFNQNHDQVGNRVRGERLSALVNFDKQKLASAALLLSPYIPMLFMGEEYGEDNPFFYFVSHTDENLVEAVREGRRKEFEGYKWKETPPDPQAEKTFADSRIGWQKRNSGSCKKMLEWNKKLISLRQTDDSLRNFRKDGITLNVTGELGLTIHRKSEDEQKHLLSFFNFSGQKLKFHVPGFFRSWIKILDSAEPKWLLSEEPGDLSSPDELKESTISLSPFSVVIYGNG